MPNVNMIDCDKVGLKCSGNTAGNGDQCMECPMYTRPQNNNSYCSADFCDQNSITLPTGKCQRCKAGTKPDLLLRRQCITEQSQVCNDRQMEQFDHAGTKTCQDCPDYTRAQERNWYCSADMCDFD